MKLSEKLYNHSPIFLQNLAVSMQGRKLHKIRYTGEFNGYLEEYLKTQWYNPEQHEEFQLVKLQELVKYCHERVPYYRTVFAEHGIKPSDIKSIENIKKFPILEKSTIRANPKQFLADNFDLKKLVQASTSGTTGTPMAFYFTKKSFRNRYALVERQRRWAKVQIGNKRASFTGRVIVPPNQSPNKKVFWRYNSPGKQLLFCTTHMTEENLKHYVEEFREFQPIFIDGYPSAVYILAKYMERNGIHGIQPKAIFTSAEPLFDYQRNVIEEVFQAKVYSYYASCEGAAFFGECPQGGYHISPEFGITEILDAQGNEVKPGEEGELVLTGFSNYAMPLIRYRMGDMGVKSEGECPCGRKLPLIEAVTGRDADILYTKERGYIPGPRLSLIFKEMSNIIEIQIIQESFDDIVVKVVPDKNFSEENRTQLESAFKACLGDSMNISIQLVDEIPRTNAGKFRAVISNLKVSLRGA